MINNIKLIKNFAILCCIAIETNRIDLLEIYEVALKCIVQSDKTITPSKPLLSVTKFDGINTRNIVLKLLQQVDDLDEVHSFKKKNPLKIIQFYDSKEYLKTYDIKFFLA